MLPDLKKTIFVPIIVTLFSCKAYMHGYTWKEAKDTYQIVTGNKDNFGDKRLTYNKGFHKHSELSNFLDCKCNNRGLPDFIYEYQSETKCRGIKLYYLKIDSVFVFEEPKKNNLASIQKEARKIHNDEYKYLIDYRKYFKS
jgi:hypothetical protein